MNTRRHTIPAPDVCTTPAGRGHRLQITDYTIPCQVLPNGLARRSPVVAVASLRLGGDFQAQARILSTKQGTVLQLDAEAYDILNGCTEALPETLELMRSVYEQMARRHVAEKAKSHARAEGRN